MNAPKRLDRIVLIIAWSYVLFCAGRSLWFTCTGINLLRSGSDIWPIVQSEGLDFLGFLLIAGALFLRHQRLARICLGVSSGGCLIRQAAHLYHYMQLTSKVQAAASLHPSARWPAILHMMKGQDALFEILIFGYLTLLWIALRPSNPISRGRNFEFSPA